MLLNYTALSIVCLLTRHSNAVDDVESKVYRCRAVSAGLVYMAQCHTGKGARRMKREIITPGRGYFFPSRDMTRLGTDRLHNSFPQ